LRPTHSLPLVCGSKRHFFRSVLILLLGAASISGQTVTDALEELRTGNYEDAERTFRRVLREDAASVRARRGLVEVLTATGEYDEARSVALEASEPVGIANTLSGAR
jgi:Flp pilus assembly protein TadD